jgi:serine/threonine protein kinase
VKYLKKTRDNALSKTCLDLVVNEVKVMSNLEHPNIVKLHEYSDKGNITKANGKKVPVLYLVLDLITGGELFDYVAIGGRFSERIARHYFKQLITALEFIHNKGYAHRDIKAENILLDTNFNLKLADFGFSAPLIGKDGSRLLKTYKGTEGYMAPEILAHQSYSGEKVDLFAVGVLLFIMIAQHPPFHKASATDGLYKMFHNQNETYWKKVAVGKPQGTFSEDLKRLINSLLAFNPKDRPTIAEIKSFMWFNEEDVTAEELREEFAKRRAKVEVNWKAKAMEEIAKKEVAKKSKAAIGGFVAHGIPTKAVVSSSEGKKAAVEKILPLYEECEYELTKMFTVEGPEEILNKLKDYFAEQNYKFTESSKKYKLQVHCSNKDAEVLMKVKVEKADENVRCIRAEKVCGARMEFLEVFNEMKKYLTEAQMLIE